MKKRKELKSRKLNDHRQMRETESLTHYHIGLCQNSAIFHPTQEAPVECAWTTDENFNNIDFSVSMESKHYHLWL